MILREMRYSRNSLSKTIHNVADAYTDIPIVEQTK